MVSSLLLSAVVTVAFLGGPVPVIGAITSSLQSILKNTHGSQEYGYPTDITRDILPVSGYSLSGARFCLVQWHAIKLLVSTLLMSNAQIPVHSHK